MEVDAIAAASTRDQCTQTDSPLITAAVIALTGAKRKYGDIKLAATASPSPQTKQSKVKNSELKNYTPEELHYYQQLPDEDRRRIGRLEESIKGLNKATVPLRFKVLLSGVDTHLKAVAIQKLNYLYWLDQSHSEYYRISHWVESVCKIPFGVYKQLPVTFESPRAEVRAFLGQVRDNMNKQVYGHTTAKDHITRLLAQWISNPCAKGLVLGIQGPMGCGKTTLVKEGICAAFNIPFAFIPLGGASDGSYLEGHSYTYEGAVWGKIVDVLMKAGCMNPVLFFDELDKVSDTSKGQEIINKLVHLTDVTQNERCTDKYFSEFEFDLSRCLVIFSYNNEELINPVLKDRMVTIKTNGYTLKDKVQISQQHMIPALLREYSYAPKELVFPDEVIEHAVGLVDKEEGVRNLRRALQDVISNLNLNRLLGEEEQQGDGADRPYKVTLEDVRKYVHTVKSDKMPPSMMYT